VRGIPEHHLQDALKDALYYHKATSELRSQLETTLHENERLTQDNLSLRQELQEIHSLLHGGRT
jgi:regulator of replication initiation timing